ncbi:hypothetical protein ACVWW7_003876 [Bradyrhizobium sp. LM6.9]
MRRLVDIAALWVHGEPLKERSLLSFGVSMALTPHEAGKTLLAKAAPLFPSKKNCY